MNTTSFQRQGRMFGLLFLLLGGTALLGCKTGKGCDCPTFGKNEVPKVNRF